MAVAGVKITEREGLAGDKSFGSAGTYELLKGTAHFAVDPNHPRNAEIADLKLAAQSSVGRVQFAADFAIMRPTDSAKGNHRLLFEVVNRGNKQALIRFNDAKPGGIDLGNGFLMRHGYTLAWCGWQHDIPSEADRMAIRVPEAVEDGKRVEGHVQVEFQPNRTTRVAMLSDRGHRPYPAADLGEKDASLSVRHSDRDERRLIPRDQWRFAREENGESVPDPRYVFLSKGFEAGKIYDVVYTAEGAPVIGLGLLSTRDVVAFLRYGGGRARENPLAGTIERAYAVGGSQSGRFLRHFFYLGLNEDEGERLVFDGAIAHIAAHARGQFNQRFGQPSSNSKWDSASLWLFAGSVQRDLRAGSQDGLLERLRARRKMPKIIFTNTAKEYWNGGAALTHVDPQTDEDLELPANVRSYLIAGAQHAVGVLPLVVQSAGSEGGHSRYPQNGVDYRPVLRAALLNLDAWVSDGVEPPESCVPRFFDGSLVPVNIAAENHARIPGVELPAEWPQVQKLDFGPHAHQGIMAVPPKVYGEPYPSLVSAVDIDGNDVAGIRLPDLSVPLATHTGWNLRHPEIGAPNLLLSLQGATHTFPRTAAERIESRDQRLSIEERYASKEDYLRRVRQAAAQLVDDRYVLPEDLDALVERAALSWELFTAVIEPAVGA